MTSITAISDLHGYLPQELPGGDVLVIAGDVARDFRPYSVASASKQSFWLASEFQSWLDDQGTKYAHIVGIGGNHDFALERYDDMARSLPWIYLRDQEVVINGLTFYGTPWCPDLPRWAFYGSDSALLARAEEIPSNVDVLISHCPPAGMGPLDNTFGDQYLCDAIVDRVAPRLVICGHVHEGRGNGDLDGIPVANVSLLDLDYKPYGMPPVTMEVV